MNSTLTEIAIRLAAGLGGFVVLSLVVGQMEHKVMAHQQARLGPMRAGGFHGWAQLVADGIKFVQKEAVFPRTVDGPLFRLAPVVAIIAPIVVLTLLPLTPTLSPTLDLGLFVVLAVMAVSVLATLMAGWASANKFSLIGALRAAAQVMAYELPMVLAAASIAMAAGTLSLPGIVNAWSPWWLVWQLPAAVIFFLAGMAELHRPPFDAPVADSEIIFGAYTEYTGIRFALFLLAEYAGVVVLCALTVVLFLGGWRGPGDPDALGWLWTLLKVFALAFVVIWARVSLPRLRADQIQSLAWKVLVPLGLAQLALTAAVKVAS